MEEKRKRDFRDRNDAYFLGNLDSMHDIMPFTMPRRCNNEAVLGMDIDLTAIDGFLAQKNAQNPSFKYTWFHVITAAIVKTMFLRPKMNWFVNRRGFYQRKDVIATFNVKRKFNDESEEAIARFVLDPKGGSVLEQVHSYVEQIVTKVRVRDEKESSTQKMDFLKKLPHFVLWIVFKFLDFTDYLGCYPKALMADDPRYSSVYISNLGSIRMNADYHHLFEKGTISFFVVINEKKKRPVFQEDGSYQMRDTLKLGMTIDERIADGYYFARSLRLMDHLLQHPELLESDPDTPVEYE